MHFRMSTSKGRGHFNASTVLDQVTISTVSETRLSCPAAPLVVLGNSVLARIQLWGTDFTCCSFKWLLSAKRGELGQARCLHVCHPACLPTPVSLRGCTPASVHTPVLRWHPASPRGHAVLGACSGRRGAGRVHVLFACTSACGLKQGCAKRKT